MTVMLRLDPCAPPLWREGALLQFGVDIPVLVLSDVLPWQERLAHELWRGLSEPGVDVWAEYHRVRRAEAHAFLQRLAPVLRRRRELPPAPVRTAAIELPRDREHPLAQSARQALTDDGWSVTVHPVGDPDAPAADLVVLVADLAVEPARAQRLVRVDRPHLALVATGAGVDVGPVVIPGASACLHCLDLHRRDRDGAWPIIALQLAGLQVPAPGARVRTLAAAALLGLLDEETPAGTIHTIREHRGTVLPLGFAGVPTASARSTDGWRLCAEGSDLVTSAVTAHPDCLCTSGGAAEVATPAPVPLPVVGRASVRRRA